MPNFVYKKEKESCASPTRNFVAVAAML